MHSVPLGWNIISWGALPYSYLPCPYHGEAFPCNSKHSTKSSDTNMQICTFPSSSSQRKGNISYLFSMQSRFNQICFALFL